MKNRGTLEIAIALAAIFLGINLYADYTDMPYLYGTFPSLFITSLFLDLLNKSQN